MPVTRKSVESRVTEKKDSVGEESAVSSTDLVVNHIVNGILAGRYVPGQRLAEIELTNLLSVSRGPVREAFRRLDALGIVVRPMHRGACIRTLSRQEAIDLMVATEPVVRLIAKLAAEKFAQRPAPRELAHVAQELKRYRDGDENGKQLIQQRRHFYDLLLALTGNSQLPSVFPTMRVHLLRMQVRSFANEEERREHREGYSRIAAAVLDGDAKSAEKAMIAHNHHQRQTFATLPDSAFPPALP